MSPDNIMRSLSPAWVVGAVIVVLVMWLILRARRNRPPWDRLEWKERTRKRVDPERARCDWFLDLAQKIRKLPTNQELGPYIEGRPDPLVSALALEYGVEVPEDPMDEVANAAVRETLQLILEWLPLARCPVEARCGAFIQNWLGMIGHLYTHGWTPEKIAQYTEKVFSLNRGDER